LWYAGRTGDEIVKHYAIDTGCESLTELDLLPKEVRRCSIGPTIGAHIGPGAVGMAYIETAP